MSFVILGFLISGFSCNRGTIHRDSCPTWNGIILSDCASIGSIEVHKMVSI